jgi:hypothetical protein
VEGSTRSAVLPVGLEPLAKHGETGERLTLVGGQGPLRALLHNRLAGEYRDETTATITRAAVAQGHPRTRNGGGWLSPAPIRLRHLHVARGSLGSVSLLSPMRPSTQ